MARSSALPKWEKHSPSHLSLSVRGRTVHLKKSNGEWQPELDNGEKYRDTFTTISRAKFAATAWLSMTLSVVSRGEG
jgi:hypothetical protein